MHHRQASLERFVGASGRVQHTAPATWARIEAADPLVLRDNHRVWTRAALGLLHDWPLASEETRSDLGRFAEALGEARPQDPDANGEAQRDLMAPVDDALDRLRLTGRRRERLVRAFSALLLEVTVDEASRDALHADSRDRTT